MSDDIRLLYKKPLFSLGECIITPGVLAFVEETEFPIMTLLYRHQSGDWGNMRPYAVQKNYYALYHQLRIFSSYEIPIGLDNYETLRVFTEGDRSRTNILLASEQ